MRGALPYFRLLFAYVKGGGTDWKAVFVLLLAACSLTIGTSPNAYPFPSEKVFSVRPDVAANITNFYTEPDSGGAREKRV